MGLLLGAAGRVIRLSVRSYSKGVLEMRYKKVRMMLLGALAAAGCLAASVLPTLPAVSQNRPS